MLELYNDEIRTTRASSQSTENWEKRGGLLYTAKKHTQWQFPTIKLEENFNWRLRFKCTQKFEYFGINV